MGPSWYPRYVVRAAACSKQCTAHACGAVVGPDKTEKARYRLREVYSWLSLGLCSTYCRPPVCRLPRTFSPFAVLGRFSHGAAVLDDVVFLGLHDRAHPYQLISANLIACYHCQILQDINRKMAGGGSFDCRVYTPLVRQGGILVGKIGAAAKS